MKLITQPIVHIPTGTVLASQPKEKYLENWMEGHSLALQMFEISLYAPDTFGFQGDLPSDDSLDKILDIIDMYCDMREALDN